MPTGRRATVAGALVLSALTLSACGGDGSGKTASAEGSSKATATATAPRTVDDAKVEAEIKDELSTPSTQVSTAQGIPGATVNCPETIIVKVGTTVTCNVSGAQGLSSGTVTFTFSSAEGTVDPSSVQAS